LSEGITKARKHAARTWFEGLRDLICAAFEAIEREAGSDACFAYTPWQRDANEGEGGGGVQGMEDVASLPKVTEALLKAGYSKEDIAKIWGGNVLRVLAAAEAEAKREQTAS
jgi:coproporphyrinogen III oxidase